MARIGYRIEGIRYTPRQLYRPECLRKFDDVICRHVNARVPVPVSRPTRLRCYIERCWWCGVMLEPQPGSDAQCVNCMGIILVLLCCSALLTPISRLAIGHPYEWRRFGNSLQELKELAAVIAFAISIKI